MSQSEAYEYMLQLAAERHWTAVYNMMQEDGFLDNYDYVALLELWKEDGL